MLKKLFLSLLIVASIAEAAPTVRAVGTVSSSVTTCAPGLPASTAIGDMMIMFCESAAEAVTASGWTELTSRSSGTGGGLTATRLTVLYRVSVDAADATTTNDPGDHCACRIVGIETGTYDSGTPFDTANITGSTDLTAGTSVTIDGSSTTYDDSLVFAAIGQDTPDAAGSTEFSGATNADLSSITEQIDNSRAQGNGGAWWVVTGVDTTAGTYTTTTGTAATDPDRRVHITFAVNAPIPSTGTKKLLSLGVGN